MFRNLRKMKKTKQERIGEAWNEYWEKKKLFWNEYLKKKKPFLDEYEEKVKEIEEEE